MDKNTIFECFYTKATKAIEKISKQGIKDIYAISFWKDNDEDDPRCPTITISYNTTSQVESEKEDASSTMEAKWNFAYWLQEDVATIGGNDKNLRQLFKEEGWFYTQRDLSKAEQLEEEGDDTAYKQLEEKDEQMQSAFMNIIISVAQEIHKRDVIKEKLGKEIPIIIHELEYYDLPIGWTTKGNPRPLIDEFLKWYEEGCK